MMKKLTIMISFCLILIPGISHAALCSGNFYQTIFCSAVSEKQVNGIIAFSMQSSNQGTISIEYDTGDIGTGSYTSNMPIDISGKLDFYDSSGNYYAFTYSGITTYITVLGIGQVQNIITGDSEFGLFFGLLTKSPE